MKKINLLYIIFFVILFLEVENGMASQEIKVVGESKPLAVSDVAQEKSEHIDSIVAGGAVDVSCLLFDQKGIYLVSDAKRSAQRSFIEKRLRVYGVANGPGPTYPGLTDSCLVEGVERVVIWPTKGCGKDLTLKQADEYANMFNQNICSFIEMEGKS